MPSLGWVSFQFAMSLFFFFFFFLVGWLFQVPLATSTVGSPAGTSSNVINLDEKWQYCKPTRCNTKNAPLIKFPFRLTNSQPQHCAYSPDFDLHCDENDETILRLPFSVNISLTEINYRSQIIVSIDPQRCLAAKLINLNLSSSPFNFTPIDFQYLYDYGMFRCPADSPNGFLHSDRPSSCPAVDGYQLLFIPAYSWDVSAVTACNKIARVQSIPANVIDTHLLRLKWSQPACGRCHARGQFCRSSTNYTDPGNQILCFHKGPSKTPLIAGATIGSVLFLATLASLYCVYRSIKTDKKIEKFLKDYKALKPTRFSYADVRRITKDFTEILGEGGYGVVYKGQLSKELYVAVKVLNSSKGNGEEFVNEIGTIGSIHHVNIVRLVGFCADGCRRALVYDYLPNDSLGKFIIQDGAKKNHLTWEKMQDIAIGIAKGIEYLHLGCDQQILHLDIKPQNILLDHNLNPKICDFGLAKFCSKEESAISMTDARGTMGYIAPEMMSRTFGRVSYKSDVYSFGMLLLDMVGGSKNRDVTMDKNEVYFPKWIYSQLAHREDDEVWIKIDDEGGEDRNRIIKKLVIVGLQCIQWYPTDRPSMKMVVQMLEGEGENLSLPPNPFPSPSANNVAGVSGRRY